MGADFARCAALSFDCYGTLVDWESGIATALRPWADGSGLQLTDAELVAAHARHETHVQQEMPEVTYPHILEATLQRIGTELGVPVSDEAAAAYGRSIGRWPAFADSAAALRRLSRRYKLIILSNVDRESFRLSNDQLGVEFDLIVTAQDAGAYKPDLAAFRYMFDQLAAIDVAPHALLHVAESLYHDHEPAAALGLDAVWINRRHATGGFGATAPPRGKVAPRWQFTSLAEFAAAALG